MIGFAHLIFKSDKLYEKYNLLRKRLMARYNFLTFSLLLMHKTQEFKGVVENLKTKSSANLNFKT